MTAYQYNEARIRLIEEQIRYLKDHPYDSIESFEKHFTPQKIEGSTNILYKGAVYVECD